MVEAISRRFAVTSLTNVSYSHRYLGDETLRDSESVLGLQLTAVRGERVLEPGVPAASA
ncbi:hypothetical protein [Jiangella asiatica]|uniref:hypothetical protein n=1 Tax=Jiangella asiatica TaxID=2530372 RepID=UPI0013A5DFE6|nr:hypothetical protein [Jiangella asiatica]